jgi:hypothetical protein
MSNSCANCKHWRKLRDEDYSFKDDCDDTITWKGPHGDCNRIVDYEHENRKAWIYKNEIWANDPAKFEPSWGDVNFPVSKIPGLEKYFFSNEATLMTKADFCCNLYEPKE